MFPYKNNINKIFTGLRQAGQVLWKGLTLSLADPIFSFSKVVCISIEDNGVYVIYGEKVFWSTRIRYFKHFPLQENQAISADYVASVVSGFVNEFKISRTTFVICLPRSWAIVRNVDLPLAAKEDLARVVSFELDRLTPLTKDYAYFDYYVLGEDEKTIKIMLAAVRADEINAYLNALRSRNIEVGKITLSAFAINSLIHKTYPTVSAVFLSLKGTSYEYGIVMNSQLHKSLSGTETGNDGSAIDRVIQHLYVLIDELKKTGKLPRIIINADDIQYNILRDKLKTLTVQNLDRDIKLNVPKQKEELSSAALGGALDALWNNSKSINLLNKSNRIKSRTPLFFPFFLLIVIVAIIFYYFIAPIQFEQKRINEINRQINLLKPEVRKVEALRVEAEEIKSDITAINHFKKRNESTMNFIKHMSAILPPGTWLTRLRITEDTAQIEGYSTSAADVILKLENSKYFHKVEFTAPTIRDPRKHRERVMIRMALKKDTVRRDKNEK